ncbi:hypothetical protein [Rhodopseudomonas palustris]|uniref:hypothetical protein n=1 Tax=Rhodopseudomonas palustris TaxID=1076 RepID=UPI0012EE9241
MKKKLTLYATDGEEPKSIDWEIFASIASVVVAICAIWFTYQQNRNAEQDRKTVAAIDITRSYLSDPKWAKDYADIRSQKYKQPSREWLIQRAFVDQLNYVAGLANDNLIDNRYLSWRIKCDIFYLEKHVHHCRCDLGSAFDKIKIYVEEGRAEACPEKEPKPESCPDAQAVKCPDPIQPCASSPDKR